jgi:uncharacterized protein YcbK (DUF882 family)
MTARGLKKSWSAMKRFSSIHYLGVLGLLVGLPLALSAGTERFPLLRRLHPTVSLSLLRTEDAPPVLGVPVPQSLVIQPLPAPEVITIPITVENVNTDEMATFDIGRAGQVDAGEARLIQHFFRCRRTLREKPLAPGVLALLADVAHRWPGHVIEVVSGFRAPPFGAPHSKHFAGHAIDLRVHGVRSSAVRDFVWREHREVGVGHYPHENFVHIDSRPGERDMAWTGEGEDGVPQYRPRWAWKARHPSRSARARLASSPLAVASATSARAL